MTHSLQLAALTASPIQQRVLGRRRTRDASNSNRDGSKQIKQSHENDAIGKSTGSCGKLSRDVFFNF